jgi:hypothetical protein
MNTRFVGASKFVAVNYSGYSVVGYRSCFPLRTFIVMSRMNDIKKL